MPTFHLVVAALLVGLATAVPRIALLRPDSLPLRDVPCELSSRPQYSGIRYKHHSWVINERHVRYLGVETYKMSVVIGIVPPVRGGGTKVCTLGSPLIGLVFQRTDHLASGSLFSLGG